MRRPHRALPTRRAYRRPDFTARWLRRRRFANANRSQYRPSGQCLGDEQLAAYRQLYRYAQRGAFNALRWSRRRDLLRHGQAGTRPADWTSAPTVDKPLFVGWGEASSSWRNISITLIDPCLRRRP